jgi:hypothetical protein
VIAKLPGWEWVAEVFDKIVSSISMSEAHLAFSYNCLQRREVLLYPHYVHAEDTSLAHLEINYKPLNLASKYHRNAVLVFFQDIDGWIRCGILESGGLGQTLVKERIVRACKSTPLLVVGDTRMHINKENNKLSPDTDLMVSFPLQEHAYLLINLTATSLLRR